MKKTFRKRVKDFFCKREMFACYESPTTKWVINLTMAEIISLVFAICVLVAAI